MASFFEVGEKITFLECFCAAISMALWEKGKECETTQEEEDVVSGKKWNKLMSRGKKREIVKCLVEITE